MHTATVTQTTTIQVPDMYDLQIGVGDSGPGGEPPFRAYVTVNGEQLCNAEELSPAGLAALNTLRAEVYAKHLAKLGVTP